MLKHVAIFASALLAISSLSGAAAAQEALGNSSPGLHRNVLSTLPKFQSTRPNDNPSESLSVTPPNPEAPSSDVILMPKFFVEENRLQRVDPDRLLGRAALDNKMLRHYKHSLTELEWIMNRFNIPLLSPSVAARARASYETNKLREELDRLSHIMNMAAPIGDRAPPRRLRVNLGR